MSEITRSLYLTLRTIKAMRDVGLNVWTTR